MASFYEDLTINQLKEHISAIKMNHLRLFGRMVDDVEIKLIAKQLIEEKSQQFLRDALKDLTPQTLVMAQSNFENQKIPTEDLREFSELLPGSSLQNDEEFNQAWPDETPMPQMIEPAKKRRGRPRKIPQI